MSIASLAVFAGTGAPAAAAADDGCANSQIRVDQGSTHLGDCRAYEQVSPVDKNYGDVQFGRDYFGSAIASSTGEAANFCSSSVSFGESPRNAICTAFVSRRDAAAQRWNTVPTTPRNCSQDPDEPGFALTSTTLATVSPDMTKAVIMQPEGAAGCAFAPIDSAAPTPSTNLYLRNFADPSSFDLLTPAPGVQSFFPKIGTLAGSYVAADEDLSNIVIQSDGQQTSEVPADGVSRPFEWAGGALRLVARDLANVPFAGPSAAIKEFQNGVSSDGDRIFFYSPTPAFPSPDRGSEIYMREGGAQTYHVTASECTSSCGSSAPKTILSATPDGSKVVFRSAEKLTDDTTPSGENAYLYTHSADPANDENLTLLSPDTEPSDGVAADIRGILGVSDDGDDVYFIAVGLLVSGQTVAPDNGTYYYLYHWQANAGDPTLLALGALRVEPFNWFGDPNPGSTSSVTKNRQVTPGGDALVVGTQTSLDPADTNGLFDAYRWSQDDGWACLSCVGAGAGGDNVAGPMFDLEGGAGPSRLRRPISDDGTRVSFNSDNPLVPQDTNGVRDAYQWVEEGTGSCETATVGGGCLYLISSGKSPSASAWIGSSADGEDVFFTTAERLVGWDTDLNADIYDARAGGGFPEPVAPAPTCSGDACQGPPAAPPAFTGVGSGSYSGGGNRQAAARSSISGIRTLSSSARAALARGIKVRLRLRVNRSGTVTVAGRARVGGKSRRVVSSSAKARKAGSVSVPFALSKRGLSELKRRGSLAVALTVRFKDARPKVVKLTLRSVASRKGGAR